ncbi:unnamed protein product [Danaus chrysippus]|uniref:(African queen) hypothetical protein n=1 Tax=Danaus chrysippus TaxID=151541 RepID=A0A8J2QTJ6_9NEOP|nr:unnamed protein product [Danaus chrysippus]
MRPKDGLDAKIQTGTFILSEKIDDTKTKKSEKELKKEMKKLEKEKQEQEKKEKKAREKEKERERQAKRGKVVCGACGGKCSGEDLLRLARSRRVLLQGRTLLLPPGLPASVRHEVRRLQPVRGGRGGLRSREHIPSEVFHVRQMQTSVPVRREGDVHGQRGGVRLLLGRPAEGDGTRRALPARLALPPSPASPASPVNNHVRDREPDPNECAGCGQELSEGQALAALDRQWHPACFACGECGAALPGEYMGRDGVPYCERDYQRLYGVRCAYCRRYIAGKVLQAGDNHHFHPTCARCTKCGDPFGDGEEMFLQGAAIWHPRCGPAPHAPLTPADMERASSELQFSLRSRTPSVNGSYCSPYSSLTRKYGYRAVSPGLTLREYRSSEGSPHRITTYSYLASEPSTLRRCVQPSDRPPASPHFHRPPSAGGTRSSSRAASKASSRPGMRALVDSIRSETPRPRSPHLNNEEPIELAVYPAAYKPPPGTLPKIERDDFPAPPYPIH